MILVETYPEFPSYPARPVNGGRLDMAMAFPRTGEWVYEPKGNGRRAVIHARSGKIWNRHGIERTESMRPVFGNALSEILRLFSEPDLYLDCEILYGRTEYGRGTIVILDLIIPRLTYQHRRIDIESKVQCIQLENIPENSLVCFPTCACPKTLWKLAREANDAFDLPTRNPMWEGIVAKKVDSLYPIQLISDDRKFPEWVKHRYEW